MLSNKQQAFLAAYLETWNATEAARRAGYAERTARSQGSRLLTNVDMQAALSQRLTDLTMSADEVLVRLAGQARGDIGDFVRQETIEIADGIEVERLVVDIEAARRARKLHLVRKVKQGPHGIEIEMYDAQGALVTLAKQHGLLKERVEHSGTLSVRGLEELTDDELAAIAAGSSPRTAEPAPGA